MLYKPEPIYVIISLNFVIFRYVISGTPHYMYF